jgi:hypothetical protein
MLHYLRRLWRGTTTSDWAWLARGANLLANIYVVVDGMGARLADEYDGIPWPVALTLGAYSKKHIFSSAKQVPMKEVLLACRDFANRTKWLWKFRKEARQASEQLLIRRPPREYSDSTRPVIDNFTLAVKNLVVAHCKKGNAWIRRNRAILMRPGFVSFTLKWLRVSQFVAAPSDKDGTFTLCPKPVHDEMVLESCEVVVTAQWHQTSRSGTSSL